MKIIFISIFLLSFITINSNEYISSRYFYPNRDSILIEFDKDLDKYKTAYRKFGFNDKKIIDFSYVIKKDNLFYFKKAGEDEISDIVFNRLYIEKGVLKYFTYDDNKKVRDIDFYYYNKNNLIYKIEYKTSNNVIKFYEELKFDNQNRIIEYLQPEIINESGFIPRTTRKYEYESNKLRRVFYEYDYGKNQKNKYTDYINYLNDKDYICKPCHEDGIDYVSKDERKHFEMQYGNNQIYLDIYYLKNKINDIYIDRYYKNKLIKSVSFKTTISGQWFGYSEYIFKTISESEITLYYLKENGVNLYKFPEDKDFNLTQKFNNKETLRKIDKTEKLDIYKLIKENGKYKYAVVLTNKGELGICEVDKLGVDETFFKSIKFN
jgi:hypothetical protein